MMFRAMAHRCCQLACLLFLGLGLASSLHAAPPAITPPFNLEWEKPAVQLEEALLGGSGRIVERKRLPRGGESWTVEGLPQPALQRAVFHLPGHKLAAVELQYGKDDWPPEQYDALLQSVKTSLESRFGAGVLIARKQDTDRGVLQTLLGYRWEGPGGSIELVYFAAQNPENVFRTVSLHYAAPRADVTSASSRPGAPRSTATMRPGPSSSATDPGSPPLPPLPEP